METIIVFSFPSTGEQNSRLLGYVYPGEEFLTLRKSFPHLSFSFLKRSEVESLSSFPRLTGKLLEELWASLLSLENELAEKEKEFRKEKLALNITEIIFKRALEKKEAAA